MRRTVGAPPWRAPSSPAEISATSTIDERSIEAAVAHAAREAGDGRVSPPGRVDQPIQGLAQAIGREGPLEQAHDDLELLVAALLGHEDAQQGLREGRARIELRHAVVREGPQQLLAEPEGKALALQVEGSQVGVEVLRANRARLVGIGVEVTPLGRDGAEVGEGAEDSQGAARPIDGRRRGAGEPSRSSHRTRARRPGPDRDRRPALGPGTRPAREMRSASSAASAPSATGSMRNSGVPASTCTFGVTKTSRTRPANGEEMLISIFMASTTARRSPVSTRSSGTTSTPTTRAVAGAGRHPRRPARSGGRRRRPRSGARSPGSRRRP